MHRPTRRLTGSLLGRSLGRFAPLPSSRWLAAPLVAVFVCAGCGPFSYLKKVASDASRAVAEAEAAGAEEYAPYEYWGAVAYLEQAKVLMGYSEYDRSLDFGDRAKQLAQEAKVKAGDRKKGNSVERDEDIAAPSDMVDAEGNKIESINEANKPKPKTEDKLEIGGEAKAGDDN